MLLLLWCLAFAWALKDLFLLLVCTTAYLHILGKVTLKGFQLGGFKPKGFQRRFLTPFEPPLETPL